MIIRIRLIRMRYSYYLNILVSVCLILVLSSCIQCLNPDDLETDIKYIRICNSTSPISLQTMNEVLIYKKLSENEASAFKCFLHCLFTQYGWMDEEGGFLLHDIKKTLEEADVEILSLEYILYKCTAMDSMDRCERSYLFTECFWQKMEQQQPTQDQLFYEIEDI